MSLLKEGKLTRRGFLRAAAAAAGATLAATEALASPEQPSIARIPMRVLRLPEGLWSNASLVEWNLNDASTKLSMDGWTNIGALAIGDKGPRTPTVALAMNTRSSGKADLQRTFVCPPGDERLNDAVKLLMFPDLMRQAGGSVTIWADDENGQGRGQSMTVNMGELVNYPKVNTVAVRMPRPYWSNSSVLAWDLPDAKTGISFDGFTNIGAIAMGDKGPGTDTVALAMNTRSNGAADLQQYERCIPGLDTEPANDAMKTFIFPEAVIRAAVQAGHGSVTAYNDDFNGQGAGDRFFLPLVSLAQYI